MSAGFDFLPDEKSHEATRLLPWVMAVMVYLSALALIGALLLHSGFDDWTKSLVNRVTVQVSGEDVPENAKDVQLLLTKTPGIASVRRLSEQEIADLLEPWLGAGNITDDLPIPVMMDVVMKPGVHVDLKSLESRLRQITKDVSLDNHAQWLGHFIQLTNMVEYTALGILTLVIMATVCIVIFGAKAGMAEHRETIQIMHLMGARDQMIAGAYQKRFRQIGLKGGLIGLALALVTILGLARLMRELAQGLVSVPDLPYGELSLLLFLPLLSALLAMVTARFTVMRELGRMV